MKEKTCVFSVKIVAEVFGRDNILIDKIKFSQMIEAPNIDRAFKEVQKRIQQKAARRGWRHKNGYRFQYHLYSPFKKLWEETAHLN